MEPDAAAPSRRRFVLAALTSAGLAGCLGTSDHPDPISRSDAMSCNQCGMILSQQPGPAGQAYYQDNSPEGNEPPARFCSAVCTHCHRFAKGDQGWTPQVTYLTDYAAVDYRVSQSGGTPVISAHLGAEGFAATDALDVVVGSDIQGSMGPAIVPFSDTAQAESFASAYGGDVIAASDISRELIAQQ
ncbi:nitrous oxide reductase accessory protein NosL [Haloplanus sp. C73]|uniref:nitrous oxide reductase accessory protein NosL n=1 Tax=Haloplanus sp. C73 TaxID=3421641 RepID=UPI003EBFE02B